MSRVPVTSQTWLQNFRPYVNGERVKWPDLQLNLTAGQSAEVLLEFEYSYLIGDPESHLMLCPESGAPETGLLSDPPFGQLVEMAEGLISLTWVISTDNAASGPFTLHFEMPLYQGMPHSPPMAGEIINFEQEVDVTFDAFAVNFGPGHQGHPCHGATHTVHVRPKPSSHLLNKDVRLLSTAQSAGVVVTPAPEVWQTLTPNGVSWQPDCRGTTQDTVFFLQLEEADSGIVSLALDMVLAHNLVTARYWQEEHCTYPDITWYSYHAQATSAFLQTPARGVPVNVVFNGTPSYPTTDTNGEIRINNHVNAHLLMSIINRYDGSKV